MGRRGRPRTAVNTPTVLQGGDAREPIGPPSALLPSAAAFAERVEAALDKAAAELDRIKQEWANATPEQDARLKERCSVQALQDENRSLLENQLTRPDLRKWVEQRWYPSSNRAQSFDDEPALGGEEQDDDDAEERDSSSEPARKKKKKTTISRADEVPPDFGKVIEMVGEEELAAALKEAEASDLDLLRPPQVELYLRKTRTADANCLLSMVRCRVYAHAFYLAANEAARVLYSITVHPAPYGPGTQHVPQQKLVCLGTTTLAEIRDNLVVGGDNIPVEEPAADEDPAENESDAGDSGGEEENRGAADEDGFDYSAQQPPKPTDEFFGGGSAAPASAREVRWKNERRVTGAAFIVEGRIYADKREGMQEDYASMILSSIEETAWPGQPPAVLEEEGGELAQPVAANDDDDLTPLLAANENGRHAAVETQPLLRPHRGKPNLRRGTLAHQTTLGEMPLRVGQPYGFIHQGDVEHIWSVDEIRALLPSDPSPWPPETAHRRSKVYLQFQTPYPLTTYLSRLSNHTLSNARCQLCEREAVDLALLDDALAGETPAHVCRACFGTLHPVKRDWEDEARPKKKARGRPKKVRTPPPLGYEEVDDGEREHMEGVRTVPILYER
ncbi:hypothetical protein C6P46_005049 [Rhodotorula mucilaginosa]|uniref:Uncharacterized protein n=1 Tax=Rhodotorula mucilaginosa TaxID=5537 RepID=A0A9P7B5I5_RHOMI|nr:hypothetical protein C6P46_005049 [Rhodotorula mucilaginosa]